MDKPPEWLLPGAEAALIGVDPASVTRARRDRTHPAHPDAGLPRRGHEVGHVGVHPDDAIRWWLTYVEARAGQPGRPLPAGVVARVRELAAARGIAPATRNTPATHH